MPELPLADEQPINELIGREPSWIVRFGISIVFIAIVILLLISWFIRYPDTLHSEITLTTLQPPIKMISKVDGRITQLFVNDGDSVEKKQPLILLENSSDFENLLNLDTILSEFQAEHYDLTILTLEKNNILNLGELQPVFNQFYLALNELKSFNASEKLPAQLQSINAISKQYTSLLYKLKNKQKTMIDRLQLEARLLDINKELSSKGLMADAALVPFKSRYLDKKLALRDIDIQFELYNIKLKELTQQLIELKVEYKEKQQNLKAAMLNSYSALTNKTHQWKQKYLLKSPINGTISFSKFWSDNQYVQAGDVVMSLVGDSKGIIGKMHVSQLGAGKISKGQRVDFELSSYPAFEFGKLSGRVKSISLVPGIEGYTVDVSLPSELVTSYGHKISYTPNLKGKAKIITQNRRLLERFLGKVIYAFDSV